MQLFAVIAASLPGLAALAALLLTWIQVGQTSEELQINESRQITSRFDAAVTNLGSRSLDVRLGGIYALERIMQDSERDHPTVVSVLTAFVREHAPLAATHDHTAQQPSAQTSPPTDVDAVVGVLAHRESADEVYGVDLSHTNLAGLMSGQGSSNFVDVDFSEANLSSAQLTGALLTRASFDHADLSNADLTIADLQDAYFEGANLKKVHFANADLTGAYLAGADLTDADFTDANLTGADLTSARLKHVQLKGARLDRVRGLPPSVR